MQVEGLLHVMDTKVGLHIASIALPRGGLSLSAPLFTQRDEEM